MDSRAAPALPLMQRLFKRETNWVTKCVLAGNMMRIDPGQTEALAFLTNGLMTHVPASERETAVYELGEIGPGAKGVIPLLVEAIDGTNGVFMFRITEALRKIGVSPQTWLPRLRPLLQSKDEPTRLNAAASILRIAPADHESHLLLMELIKKNSIFTGFASKTLGEAGPAAAEAVPVLREVLKGKANSQDKDEARSALELIEAKPGGNQW
jgi:hypothetical protein